MTSHSVREVLRVHRLLLLLLFVVFTTYGFFASVEFSRALFAFGAVGVVCGVWGGTRVRGSRLLRVGSSLALTLITLGGYLLGAIARGVFVEHIWGFLVIYVILLALTSFLPTLGSLFVSALLSWSVGEWQRFRKVEGVAVE